MAQEPEHQNPLYDERENELISPKDGKPTIRIARFIKPFAENTNQAVKIPETPLLNDIFTHKNLQKWPLKVHFTGWYKPQKDWKRWYDRLVINHASTWIKAGILDGIQASLHEIPCNRDLVLGVCEFWCPKTNTFIFPWGEATITLEDVMILGGFPVIGAPFTTAPIKEDLVGIVKDLRRARRELGREREATHSVWIQHFMEEEEEGEIDNQEGDLEHVAFLSLWLSRFVIPKLHEGKIDKKVFPIATLLSQGTPIALAPVVLANLYHDLTKLTLKAVVDPPKNDSKVYVSGLFQIVQLWVCERFSGFWAHLAKPLELGFPRVARWDKVNFEVTLSHMRSKLKVSEDFQWRPYASNIQNWDHFFPFYGETEQIIPNCAVLDDCLLSFGRFLHTSELIGIKCKEKYQPHRVAMQFGFDQDIPGKFRITTTSWDKFGFYVPSRRFEPGFSKRYCDWWKDCMLNREEAVIDALERRREKSSRERSVKGKDSEEYRRYYEKEKKSSDFPRPSEVVPMMCDLKLTGQNRVKSPSTVEKPASRKGSYEENEGSELDNMPLAMRLSSNMAVKGSPNKEKTVKRQAFAAPKSRSQVKNRSSRDSNAQNVKNFPLDSIDIDHVPLALRLKSTAERKESYRKSMESYDSTKIERDSSLREKCNARGTTDVTVKEELEVRVTKLESAVAALEAAEVAKFVSAQFSV